MKAKFCGEKMKYIERVDYNKVITVKLVLPGGCNAHCSFCYMKDYKEVATGTKEEFLRNYLDSLEHILNEIGDKNPVSLDITGNEPTFDSDFLKIILKQLKEFDIQKKVQRVTITTNGSSLKEVIPYFKDVINYVNISVHDYDLYERQKIMGFKTFTDQEYIDLIRELNNIGITASAVAVIHKPITNFKDWFNDFVDWCKKLGFIALRLRCDVFWNRKDLFDEYMIYGLEHKDYSVINHEATPDSHWCRLRRFDKFRVFFLHGVVDTSFWTKGIEYVIEDDGICYCDFYKNVKLDDYQYEVGKIYDLDVRI